MAAGLYGFRVKVDASGVRSGLRRKFILHIDYVRHKTIGDVVCSVENIVQSKEQLVLFVQDYYLPVSESIHTLRDGDDVTVFCKAAFDDDTSNIAEPGENNIEYSEWKKKKKYKKEKHSKYEKKQKKTKYKTEASDCTADLSNINGEYDNGIFNMDATGNLESEEGSMLVNCSSLVASLDECQTSVKAPEIEAFCEQTQVKINKEEENLKQREREENSGAAPNFKYNKNNKHWNKFAVGPLMKVLRATEGEVHTFTYNKTNEQNVTQDNNLNSPDVLSSKKGAVPQTENRTEKCGSVEDEVFKFPQTKDPENLSVSQKDASSKNKRKRKRIRTHKKNKVQKLESQSNTSVTNLACSDIKTEESLSVSCKHIRFADDVEADVEVSNTKVSANTTIMDNLENSGNTVVTENVIAETSEDPLAVLIAQNASFTSSQENKVDTSKITSLEENIARPSTQWDVKLDVTHHSAFSKLLSLGWTSTPVVYERKKPNKTETNTIISKDETEKVEHLTQETSQVNGHKEMTGMNLPANISLTTEKIVSYPLLESSPRKKDVLAFKMLRIGEDYTPQLSDYIIAEVKYFCPDSENMELVILQGADQCGPPKGKFNIETDEMEGESNAKPMLHCKWNELIGTRILHP